MIKTKHIKYVALCGIDLVSVIFWKINYWNKIQLFIVFLIYWEKKVFVV